MEPVGTAFAPQVAVADQRDRGDMWSKRRSSGRFGSEVGFPLALQVNLTRHVCPRKAQQERFQSSRLRREVKTFKLRTLRWHSGNNYVAVSLCIPLKVPPYYWSLLMETSHPYALQTVAL